MFFINFFECIPPPVYAAGDVSVNEICAKNTSYKASDGKYYDWTELYNSSLKLADISGWGLSDDAKEPYKYKFPNGTIVPAKGRLVIFCDSNAVIPEDKSSSSESDGKNSFIIAPFGISSDGESIILTDKSGNIADMVEFGALSADNSYGQYPEGSGNYGIMECTPSKPNSETKEIINVEMPVFSHESGFYDKDFWLKIDTPKGTTVYYTTDGSDPSEESEKYTKSIKITDRSDEENVLSARTDISADYANAPREKVDKATVIRAVAVDRKGNMSDTVTKTYFLGKTNDKKYKDIKVVSLVTDPDNLFDYNTGIYVTGKYFGSRAKGGASPWTAPANYTQKGDEWERAASFELFENGESQLSQTVGIRIKGAATRYVVQKSFSIFARSEYGEPELEYDFFDGTSTKAKNGKIIDNYKSIVLRNGGNDNAYAHFRDSINQKLVADRNFAHQAFSECIVFIDGEYWGIYQIAEKVNADYLKAHYSVKKNDVALIKNSVLESGTDQDLKDWNSFLRKYAYADMTNEDNYNQFCEEADVQNFIDYFSVQIYWSNGDWPPNNMAAWRTSKVDEDNPYADGRWRLFLFDTDFSTELYGNTDTAYNANGFGKIRSLGDNFSKTFTNLLRNPDFKKQFALSFMDIANYNFSVRKTENVIKYYLTEHRQRMLDTLARFYSGGLTGNGGVNRLKSEYDKIISFYNRRFGYATENMKNALGLKGSQYTLTVKNSRDMGSISLNTLNLDKKLSLWSGKYYSDYEITITAKPYDGYKFSHWEAEGVKLTAKQKKTPEISFKLEEDVTVRAVYE